MNVPSPDQNLEFESLYKQTNTIVKYLIELEMSRFDSEESHQCASQICEALLKNTEDTYQTKSLKDIKALSKDVSEMTLILTKAQKIELEKLLQAL